MQPEVQRLKALSEQPIDPMSCETDGSNPTFPWRCSLDLLAEPLEEIAWLLEDLLPVEGVVLLSGREGSMKTWLALQWAKAIADGSEWLGRPTEVGSVLWLDGEMPRPIFQTRLHAVGGSQNLYAWRWQDEKFPTRLDDPMLLEAGKTHRLLIIDSLKRFMGSRDENSSTEMAIITDALRKLTQWGATVLAIHHGPKDPARAGYRGSTELGAGVDLALTLEKREDQEKEILVLTASKTRYAEDHKLTLRVERAGDKPEFRDTSGETQAKAQAAQIEELNNIQRLMKGIISKTGQHPNQTALVREAKNQGLGSRKTILRWLQQGEGTYWKSELDGRSRIYDPIVHLSPPLGAEQ